MVSFLCGSFSSDLPKEELSGLLVDTGSDKGGGAKVAVPMGVGVRTVAVISQVIWIFLWLRSKHTRVGLLVFHVFLKMVVLLSGETAPSTGVLLTFCISSFFIIL